MRSPSRFAQRPPVPRAVAVASAATLLALLQACGGDDVTEPVVTPPSATTTLLTGTVATGAAVPGATITVVDADSATANVTGTADANGHYSVNVSTLTAPLLVSASGTLNGDAVNLVAVVPSVTADAGNTANVTPLTHAVAALVAPGGDPTALATATAMTAVTATAVSNASTLVVTTLASNPDFAALLGSNFNPLTTAFTPDGSGVDAVLDQISVEVGASGVGITNLAAPATAGGQPEPVTLTASQASTPTVAPTLPTSTPAADLPTSAEMLALAKKQETCLALPLAQRVTLDANKNVTAVSATCSFAPGFWKSDGGDWASRVGMNTLRYDSATGARVGTPTIAVVLPAPNHSGSTFQNPYCNTQTCVIMSVPVTTASGKPSASLWHLAKVDGQWNYVGNQFPYALGVEHRLSRRLQLNTAVAAANPTNLFAQDRFDSVLRLNFNLDASGEAASNVRAVVWKGPGLPAAGVVTHRSQRCSTADRMVISNQEGSLTDNNSTNVRLWSNFGGSDFLLDAAKLDGTALTMPTPSGNWATNASPRNWDVRSAPFTGSAPAWSVYTAEIYFFNNTSTTPDQVIKMRSSTPYERAAAGVGKSWPVLASSAVADYLNPAGSKAGSQTGLAHSLSWTNPADGYVSFAYLFSQNRLTATNSQSETATDYWKRSNMFFRLNALGDSSATAYEWAANASGTSMSSPTSSSGSNPNPRCGADEVLPLESSSTTGSYREVGLQFRGTDRKLYQNIQFWSN